MKKLKISKKAYNYQIKQGEVRNLKIATVEETINKIYEGKSICRYGDGEFDLILGRDLPFQNWNSILANRLKEILIDKSQDTKLLIAIPKIVKADFKGYNDYAYNFWINFYVKNIIKISKLINKDKQYYSYQISRFYIDFIDKSDCNKKIDDLKKIWDKKDLLIVEGNLTRMGVGNDLFENAKSIKRILCPAKNAFDKYNEILKCCLQFSKDRLILIALGPTATVLAYDLSKNGCQALDIGHIDIEYEWFLRQAKDKIKIENKYVNEAGGFSGSREINDITYKNSIVREIL